jgi:hypothetical protein
MRSGRSLVNPRGLSAFASGTAEAPVGAI